MYEDMKQAIGVKVKNSFSTILALRKYKVLRYIYIIFYPTNFILPD